MWIYDAKSLLNAYSPEVRDADFGFMVVIKTNDLEIQILETDDHEYHFKVNAFLQSNGNVLVDDSFLFTNSIDDAAHYAKVLYAINSQDTQAIQGMVNILVE